MRQFDDRHLGIRERFRWLLLKETKNGIDPQIIRDGAVRRTLLEAGRAVF
jgi:hypothetical protein